MENESKSLILSGNPVTGSPPERTVWSLRFIREAIRSHRISFPSQVPVFTHLHRTDIQWRIVLLYFIQGWPCQRIAARYGMTRERVMQLLRQWTSRAMTRGFIDCAPTERECAYFVLLASPA